jgi:hypothetical protein
VRAALRRALRHLATVYRGMYLAPYRAEAARAHLREEELFLLLTASDLLGVPNPVHFYALELYPEMLERYHDWHRRMGMERAPEGGWRCC